MQTAAKGSVVQAILLFVAATHRESGGEMSDPTDIDAMLRGLSEGLEYSSLHRRLAALASSQECWKAMSKPQTRVLVRMILKALCNPQYLERSWIVSLYKALAFLPPAMCVVHLGGELSFSDTGLRFS